MSDLTRVEVIERLNREAQLCERIVGEKTHYVKCLEYAIASLKTDEAYDIIYEGLDFIEIPEGATNGDMIRTLFPDGIPKDIVWTLQGDKGADWWNSPYKKDRK